MSIFAMAAIGATGLGPAGAGWIEMDRKLEWRWIQWIHLMYVHVIPYPPIETDMGSQSNRRLFRHHAVCNEGDSEYSFTDACGEENA